MATRGFSVEGRFTALDKITGPVRRIARNVSRFSRNMARSFDRINTQVSKFTSGIRRAGVVSAVALGAITASLASAAVTGANFEQTLVNATAKFPEQIRKGAEAFQDLEDAARQVGLTTEFTASQAAEGLNFLAMAGFNAEQAIAALPGVTDLATAAQMDLGTATDIATDSLGAFGLATKDAAQLGRNLTRINDVMARTTTSSNTSIAQMFEVIKDAGSVATDAGVEIETFATFVGVLADSGKKATTAGTTLKNMFLRLQAPAPVASKLLRRLGVDIDDGSGNMRDMVDILGDLQGALSGVGNIKRNAALKEIFGLRAVTGASILMRKGTEDLTKFREKLRLAMGTSIVRKASESLKDYNARLDAATGATRTMSEVMRDTLLGRFKTLLSSIEAVKIQLTLMNMGPLEKTVELMTAWVRANKDLIANSITDFIAETVGNLDNIITALRQMAGVIVLWAAFSALMTGLSLVVAGLEIIVLTGTIALTAFKVAAWAAGLAAAAASPLFGMLGAAIASAFVFNPVGLFIAGVAALYLVGATIIKYWEPVWDFFADGFDSMIDGAFKAWDKISGIWDKFSKIFGFGEGNKTVLSKEVQTVVDAFSERDDRLYAAPSMLDRLTGGLSDLFAPPEALAGAGGPGGDEGRVPFSPTIISPFERQAAANDEQQTNKLEVVVKAEPGTSATVADDIGGKVKVKQQSGAF